MESTDVLEEFVASTIKGYRSQYELANLAIAQVPNAEMHVPLDANTNSIVIIMKHVSGNLLSRWTDFLTTDGEKTWRDRDQEFVDDFSSRDELMAYWAQGWECVLQSLESLSPTDLTETVTIRGEPHTVSLAIQRSLAHTAYHVGQIVMVARIHCGENWETLSIPRGKSQQYNQANWGTHGSPPDVI